jgi:LDH2 family malate/lactate/ureidoglycolate dehydrogenase
MDTERETGISQFFLALDPSGLGTEGVSEIADRIVASIDSRYPGQRTLEVRAENAALGVPVEAAVWREVQEM